jgi:signal transduction histidine kinase
MNTKKRYTLFFWLAIALILVLNLLLWIYLNQVEVKFASNLKERLVVENRSISRTLNDNYLSKIIPGESNSLEYISILQSLENIRSEDSLQSILILDPDGKILVSSPEILSLQNEFIRSDSTLYGQALLGNFVTSDMQQIAGERFMSSYGPVFDVFGMITGIQIVEAKATYFSTIETLRNQLLLFSIINFMVITIIAFILFRMIARTIQFQARIKDQEHLAQLGEMSANVAHEIRNPLGIIEGSNELIRKKYGRKDDEIFDYIPIEVKRLTGIINTFLTFARTPKVHKKPFKLNDILSRLKVGLRKKKDINIIFPEAEKDMFINSDKNLLEQAILNILLNATEAVEGGATITVSVEQLKNNIMISIHNNGPAIPADIMEQIFKPFFTTKEQGTGLGLAITRRTIELLGGSISVKSGPSEGTTFTLDLPQ